MSLRAFSVRQPWSGLLMTAVNCFEVRTWQPPAPGYFVVHASSKSSGLREVRDDPWYKRALAEAGMADERSWPLGAILGLIEFDQIWQPDQLPPDLTKYDEFLCGHVDDVFLWQVGRRWPFAKPVPCLGKLNLWRPPEEIWGELNRQLDGANAPAECRVW